MRCTGYHEPLLFVSACATAPAPRSGETRPPQEGALAFVDVSVVPRVAGRLLTHQTVVVRGERIVALGPVDTTPVPPEAVRVEGQGRFLMPGLVDMHLHLVPDLGQREIAGVRVRGRWLPRAALDALLEATKAMASAPAPPP